MKRQFQKKLSLNKENVAMLNGEQMENIKGEAGSKGGICPTRGCTVCRDECNCTGWGGVATGCKTANSGCC